MKHPCTTETVHSTVLSASSSIHRLRAAITGSLSIIVLLSVFLATCSADAQAFIRFNFTQERITVAINSTNSNTITNVVSLSGGTTNANFDVSGLPPGAGYSLTDTNGNALTSTSQDTNLWLTVNTTNIPEGLYNFRLNAGGLDTNGVPVTNSIVFVLQAAHIWNGSLNTSNAWSSASSWLGGVPSASSDVVFTDLGAQTNNFSAGSGIPFTNSYVDATMIIGSLRFAQNGQTNLIATNPPPYYHHIQILPSTTLTIAGTNGFTLMRDYFDDAAAGLGTMGVIIDGGVGSKLVISNQNANVTAFVGGSLVPTLNMSNLETLVVKVSRVGIADYQLYPNYRDLNTGYNVGRDTNTYSARPRQMSANIYLAKTNTIVASYQDPQNYTNEFTRSYAFSLFNNEQNGVGSASSQQLLLGVTNVFLLDGVCFFDANGNGTVKFGPTNGVAFFRGTNGTSRLSVFTVSDDGGTNEAASNMKGTVDFSAGTVNILADRLYLSRDRELIQTNQTPNVQADLTIGKGSMNVNTAILGYQEHTKPDWTAIGGGQPYLDYCEGRLFVTNGGTLTVNGTLTLGYTADTNDSSHAEQYGTYGQITVSSNSTIIVSNIVVDGGLNFYDPSMHLPGLTPRANTITINQAGNLIVSNSIGGNNYTGSLYPTFLNPGSPGLPLDTLTIGQSGILTLFVSTGKTNVYVRNLVSSGTSPGTIKIASLPVGITYPTTIPLIYYSTATPFLAADMSLIGGSVQGYILNDSANQTIDLFLTTNAPNTLIWRGNINNNWDTTTRNWVTASGGFQTNFSMGDIVIFDDSSSVTSINIVGALVPNQATNGVTINNTANVYTFNPDSSGGSIAGTAKILKQGTNVVVFNTAESGPISITAGEVDVASSGVGSLGATTLASNAVLNVLSGGSVVGGLTSTGVVVIASSGAISSGAVTIGGGSFVNSGFVNASGGISISGGSLVTNNVFPGEIDVGAASTVSGGSTLANFGFIKNVGGRLNVAPAGAPFDGATLFGTGIISDPNPSAGVGRVSINPTGILSPGSTPNNSIGTMTINARVDLQNYNALVLAPSVGELLIEVDFSNPQTNDMVIADSWQNITGMILMTNINPGAGSFANGNVFQIFQNDNGSSVVNIPAQLGTYPLMNPIVPVPGLQWGMSNFRSFGIITITNTSLIWDGSGTGTWDTNSSVNNWKSGQIYTDNQGAMFDERASGTTTITLTGPVAPMGYQTTTATNINPGVSTNVVITTNNAVMSPGIVVSNSTKPYVFTGTGKISGVTSLYKTGPGTLSVLTSNDFVGNTIIDGGTVVVTNLNGSTTLTAFGIGNVGPNNEVIIDGATLMDAATTNLTTVLATLINSHGATIQVANTNELTTGKFIFGAGTLTKTGPGTLVLSQADAYGGGTVINTGTVRLNNPQGAGFGTITLTNTSTLAVTNNITFTNTINIASAGTTINSLGINTNVSGGAWTGTGSVTIVSTNAASQFVFTNSLSGFSGSISFGSSLGTFMFNNKSNLNVSTGSAAAAFDLGTGSAILNNFNGGGLTYNLGSLAGGPNTVLAGRTVTNTLVLGTTYSIGAKGNSTIFAGKIVDGQPVGGLTVPDAVTIVKVGSGTLQLNGANTYTGPTTVINGTLGGTGSITSPLTVASGGTLSPGSASSVGTFTVSNNVTLGGTVLMKLNRAGSPATNDLLVVTGTLTGGGALVVTNIGPGLMNGDTFKLFSKPVSGFSSTTLPTGGGSYNWANNLAVDGSITLTSGGVVTSPTLSVSVSGNNLTLSWPQANLGWNLQAQTNSLSVGLWTNWFVVAGSSSATNAVIPINSTNGAVFYRLVSP